MYSVELNAFKKVSIYLLVDLQYVARKNASMKGSAVCRVGRKPYYFLTYLLTVYSTYGNVRGGGREQINYDRACSRELRGWHLRQRQYSSLMRCFSTPRLYTIPSAWSYSFPWVWRDGWCMRPWTRREVASQPVTTIHLAAFYQISRAYLWWVN